MTQTIDQTLAERGARYGDFVDHAEVTQSIKVSIASGNNWYTLDDDMKEAMEMVAHKFGRILNGDPEYIDSWTDCIGYLRLVEKRLIDEQSAGEAQVGRDEPDEAGLAAVLDKVFGMSGEKNEQPCDDLACNTCHPGIGEALRVLLKAGVIKQSD